MEMTILEFDALIEQKLATLADTEQNQKKAQKRAELDSIYCGISDKEKDIQSAIEREDYDRAVALKLDLAQLEGKAEILKDIVAQLKEIPDYDTEDLRKLCLETRDFYEKYKLELYKQRIPILKALEENTKLMNEANIQFSCTDKKIEVNMPNYDCFGHYVSFKIPTQETENLNTLWKVEKCVAELEARKN